MKKLAVIFLTLSIAATVTAQAKRRTKLKPYVSPPCNAQVAEAPILYNFSLGLDKAALEKRWPSFSEAYTYSNATYLSSPMRVDYAQVLSQDLKPAEVPADIDFTLSFFEGKLYSYMIEYNDPKVSTVPHLIAKLGGNTLKKFRPGTRIGNALTIVCDGVVMEIWSKEFARGPARILVVDRRVDEKLTENNMLIEAAPPTQIGKLLY